MSSPVIDKLTEVQEQVLESLEQVQKPIVSAVRRAADSVESYVPELPALPSGDKLQSAQELIANQYDFAVKLLELNKQFADALADAAKPVADKVVVVEVKTAKTTTKKAA